MTEIILGESHLPLAMAVNEMQKRVLLTTASGKLISWDSIGNVTRELGTVGQSTAIAVDSRQRIYVMDQSTSEIRIYSGLDMREADKVPLSDPPNAMALGPDGALYVVTSKEGTVSRVDPETLLVTDWFVEAPNWFREKDEIFSSIDVDPEGNVVVGDPNNGFVILLAPDGTVKKRFQISREAVEVKFAPNGDVYSITDDRRLVTVMRTSGQYEVIQLNGINLQDLAIDSSGVVYLADYATNKVLRIALDDTFTEWATVGSGPVRIAVDSGGVVYTANQGSNTMSRIVPGAVGGGDTPQENLKAALTPVLGSVTRTTGGFTVPVSNYDPDFVWAVTTSNGMAEAQIVEQGGSHSVVVTGLPSGSGATVSVTTARTGYEDGSAEVSGSSLNAARVPMFGSVTPTADGFTVPVWNYDPDFVWAVTTSNEMVEAQFVEQDGSRSVVVTGLPSGSGATVSVTTTRDGYEDGEASVTGSSAEAGSGNSGGDATDAPTTIPDESSSVPEASSSTSEPAASMDESSSTTESGAPMNSPGGPMGAPAQVISTGTGTIAVIPVVSISNAVANATSGKDDAPSAVLVSPATEEIACTSACVDALFASVGATDGVITAYVGTADPVTIPKGTSAILKVGKKDATVKFVVTDKEGKETTVNIPVVHTDTVAEPAGDSSGFSLLLIVLIISGLLLALLSLYFAFIRLRRVTVDSTSEKV